MKKLLSLFMMLLFVSALTISCGGGADTTDGPGEDPIENADASETPEGETPEGETPEGETPEGETPEGETPEGETPEGETPEGETPEGEEDGK